MRITVLLRRLRDQPNGTPSKQLLGECEIAAFSTALALREAVPGTQVNVLAAGPASLEDEVLTRALMAGADHAVRVSDQCLESVDYLGIARVLAAACRKSEFDLVLCGDRSEDEGQGAVGPAVAELLGIPHVTAVVETALLEEATPTETSPVLRVSRRDPGMTRTFRLPLPALITVARTHGPDVVLGTDPLPSCVSPVEALDLTCLGIQAAELRHRDRCIGRAHPVRVMRNATVVKDADEFLARLREDRLLP
ncbi:MAG: hypothetical protein HY698_18075 [Deltaproteobacteria bacterium]|nr:hypothetical protein [Deltaproteobacteria bacterium]